MSWRIAVRTFTVIQTPDDGRARHIPRGVGSGKAGKVVVFFS